MSYCPKCGKQLTGTERFCRFCGNPVPNYKTSNQTKSEEQKFTYSTGKQSHQSSKETENNNHKSSQQFTKKEKSNTTNSFTKKLNEYVGNTGTSELSWKDLFTNVFKTHTSDEAESVFICGTKNSTPPLTQISSTWVKPWLYSRVFVLFLATFVLLSICWEGFENINVIPGIMIIGAFAVPFTTLVLFLEVNAFRNISFYTTIKTFFIGGCLSLFATLTLYSVIKWNIADFSFMSAATISIVEESGKAMVIYSLLKHAPQYKYILNALLIGAAVGAGFAAFESSGYAFLTLLTNLGESNPIDIMMNNIYTRGFLAPGGHVAWGAISGVALILAKETGSLTTDVVRSKKFWKIFIIPIALHTLWDWEIFANIGGNIHLAYWLLLIVVWIVIIAFINMGFKELKKLEYEKVSEM